MIQMAMCIYFIITIFIIAGLRFSSFITIAIDYFAFRRESAAPRFFFSRHCCRYAAITPCCLSFFLIFSADMPTPPQIDLITPRVLLV